jgi:hypothetical protein
MGGQILTSMKRFDIITEIDARILARGETVELSRHGHITPLAQDTLNERRVTVVHEGRASATDATLVPVAGIRSVAIASDHTGVTLRRTLVGYLRGRGLAIQDLGTERTDPVDYPDVAAAVARTVSRGEADAGIVIDGDLGDHRAVFSRAQWRERADAWRHPRQCRRGASDRVDVVEHADAGASLHRTPREDSGPGR